MLTKLQIISGKYRGKRLIIPSEGARPTQQRTRSAIFNTLNSLFLNSFYSSSEKSVTVWDAFAGSGAMGIEFISRFGANTAIFTDINPAAIKAIKENSKNIQSDCKIIISQNDALKSCIPQIAIAAGFLIIFVDPPYSEIELGQEFINKIGKSDEFLKGTIIVWEFEKNFNFQIDNSKFLILKEKVYGRAQFLILKKL